jgi:hypothetical protein
MLVFVSCQKTVILFHTAIILHLVTVQTVLKAAEGREAEGSSTQLPSPMDKYGINQIRNIQTKKNMKYQEEVTRRLNGGYTKS